jgi:hypothetical protein
MIANLKVVNLLRKRRREQIIEESTPSQPEVIRDYGEDNAIHYLATQRGFFKKFEEQFDDEAGHVVTVPIFTGNPRIAMQFDSFAEADAMGHRLMKPRSWVRYYAIFKNA